MKTRTAIALFATTLAIVGCGGGTDSGSGELRAVIREGGETIGHTNFNVGSEKTFGVFICVDGDSATIESVEPIHTEGEVEFVEASVYTSEDMFVGAAHGYPPDGIDETKVESAEGAVVSADCSEAEGEKVQLLIGARRTGIEGGVLDGFLVTTDTGELEVDLTILMCGEEMEYCEALEPAPSSSTTAP